MRYKRFSTNDTVVLETFTDRYEVGSVTKVTPLKNSIQYEVLLEKGKSVVTKVSNSRDSLPRIDLKLTESFNKK